MMDVLRGPGWKEYIPYCFRETKGNVKNLKRRRPTVSELLFVTGFRSDLILLDVIEDACECKDFKVRQALQRGTLQSNEVDLRS